MRMDNPISKVELLSKLQKYIEMIKDMGQITALFLFGSYATGRQTALSDIDLAVLFDKSVEEERYLPERLRLMGELSTILGTDIVELVVLNEAPPGLAYRVIRDGELLFVRDECKSQVVDFKVRTMDRYFDYQPVQKIFSEGLARRIREGSFGGR